MMESEIHCIITNHILKMMKSILPIMVSMQQMEPFSLSQEITPLIILWLQVRLLVETQVMYLLMEQLETRSN